MIGIIDYNAGNITSVERALKICEIPFVRSKNPKDLENCEKLIFPGVGEAEYAMNQLKITQFDEFIKRQAQNGKKILGICLGSQIIFEHSQEGNVKCLGLIEGEIQHFDSLLKNHENLKIPHMGWNNLHYKNNSSLILQKIPENSDFYFVHSYLICPKNDEVIKGYVDYGVEVPAVIQKDNIFACQFHPEKSGKVGLQILRNFYEL